MDGNGSVEQRPQLHQRHHARRLAMLGETPSATTNIDRAAKPQNSTSDRATNARRRLVVNTKQTIILHLLDFSFVNSEIQQPEILIRQPRDSMLVGVFVRLSHQHGSKSKSTGYRERGERILGLSD